MSMQTISSTTTTVTIQDMQAILSAYVEHNMTDQPIMLWGAPGIGKTSIVEQIAQQHGYRCMTLILSQLIPQDLRGIPYIVDGVAKWATPEFFPRDPEEKVILFLDEINMAPRAIHAAAQRLILEHKVGEYHLPDATFVVAAGNRPEKDEAAVIAMTGPLANRFNHYHLEADLQGFMQWALKHGIDERILGFLNFRPDALQRKTQGAMAFPTPRSWERASKLQQAGLSIAPAVGIATEVEYLAYQTIYQDLPDIDAIFAGNHVPIPEKIELKWAVITALASRFQTVDDVVNAIQWAAGLPSEYITVFWKSIMPLLEEKRAQKGSYLVQVAHVLGNTPILHDIVEQMSEYTALFGKGGAA